MKNILLFLMLTLTNFIIAQPVGYYNGTAGLKGVALKEYLHEVINDHIDFSYGQAKFIINYSDADPNNENNVILFYTQRSHSASDYGSGGNFINREHVWAKSHGDFSGIRPMDGDAFNLRPADASVNIDKSNKDFGNVKPGGTQHNEATECWYSSNKWEPGDLTKGQVARIILYMSTRYEGTNGEMDLEAVDGFSTYPKPEHGDLTTLLEWNRQFPPSDFERRRNERIYSIQQNRNPYIDHPEWADLIWADAEPDPIQIDNFSISPKIPKAGETANLSFSFQTELVIENLSIYYGKEYNSESINIELDLSATTQNVSLNLSGYSGGDLVHFKIVANSSNNQSIFRGNFELPKNISSDDLTSIVDVQGTGESSPLINKAVTIAGRIVGNYDNTVYIQSGNKDYSAVCVYGSLETGYVGDSIIVTGAVTEYNGLTEITDINYLYNFKENSQIEPTVIKANDVSEKYEGMLVTIEDVTFSNAGSVVADENTTVPFSDDSGISLIYMRYGSPLIGYKIPGGTASITGVVSQFEDSYQILPRKKADIIAAPDTILPNVKAVLAIDAAWITVEFDEIVDKVSSENIANYSINHNITILSAFRYEEGKTVILNVSGISNGTHTLSLNGIKDASGNMLEATNVDFLSSFTSSNDIKDDGLLIFPNPVTEGKIEIKSNKVIYSLLLTDIYGRTINKANVRDKNYVLNINTEPGIYLITVRYENSDFVNKKIVVQ